RVPSLSEGTHRGDGHGQRSLRRWDPGCVGIRQRDGTGAKVDRCVSDRSLDGLAEAQSRLVHAVAVVEVRGLEASERLAVDLPFLAGSRVFELLRCRVVRADL